MLIYSNVYPSSLPTQSPRPIESFLIDYKQKGRKIYHCTKSKADTFFFFFLLTKAHIIKAMVFPVVMYGCKNWTIRKAEYWRIDGFELWCWRRLFRVPWTARRSKQSILKEINSEYSLEWLMLKLKLQYFSHLMGKANSFAKTLMLGKIEGRRRGWQGMRRLNGITDTMSMSWASSGRC